MAFLQLNNLWVSELADGVASLVLDVPGGKTNNVNRGVLDELEKALDKTEHDGRFRLLVIRSGKENHFAAGPGIEDFAALKTPEDFAELAAKGQQVFDRLQSLTIPTVAFINGGCQGGGLELALACDYRIMLQHPTARLAVAGSDLGLMPAWGATQRLPRIVGLERGLQMLLGDRPISADVARQWGLADAVVQQRDEMPAILNDAHKRPLRSLPRRTWRQWLLERFRWGRWMMFEGAANVLKRRLPDDLKGPWEILAAVRRGIDQGMPAGLEQERTAFVRLAQQPAFRNLVRIQQSVARIRQDNVEGARPLRKIGIVGAGTRGLQVLALALTRGCHITVREADDTSLGLALYQVLSYFLPAVQAGIVSESDFQKNMANIHGTTAWKGFGDLELVLETLGPDPEKRVEMLRQMEKETGPDTLLVAATGDDTLAELRAELTHPERLAGVHFLVPVTRGNVVEVVGPPAVEENIARDLSAWVVHLGGIPIPVKDGPGMLVRRVWLAAILEALLLVQEKIAVERVDESLRRFGMLRGPLEQADLLGLQRLEALAGSLASLDPVRFPFDPLLTLMIDKGWLGQKNKLGFYRHDKGTPKPNAQLAAMIRDLQGIDVKVDLLSPHDERIRCRERIVARTINEAAWCLAEGVVADADTLDLAMVLSGWAPHRGGPLTFAREKGIQTTIDSLTELAGRWGERFLPCPALKTMASRAP
jgi:3-hydroxyacyl-CoA dehydrogenase/enoyl-CoA hydratase/carnithine racemase